MTRRITAREYWNSILKQVLLETGYIPEAQLCFLTTSKELAKFITPEIVQTWYRENNNINDVLEDILYPIHTQYFSQSRNTRELEDLIAEFYEVEYLSDEEALIKERM